ncbi:MAG: hypothetical protein H6607_12745 [Flavobacteriales bacterium]|nr:hypothetical protein [Flavobacteriales bacterium]
MIDLINNPPQPEEFFLIGVSVFLFVTSFLAWALWFDPSIINHKVWLRYTLYVIIVVWALVGILLTSMNWWILTAVIFAFYLWFKFLNKNRITVYQSIVAYSILNLLLLLLLLGGAYFQ